MWSIVIILVEFRKIYLLNYLSWKKSFNFLLGKNYLNAYMPFTCHKKQSKWFTFFLPFYTNELYLIQRAKLFTNVECNVSKPIIILKTFLLFEKRIVFFARALENNNGQTCVKHSGRFRRIFLFFIHFALHRWPLSTNWKKSVTVTCRVLYHRVHYRHNT